MNEIRIGLIGAGWMGKAHATAFKNVPMVFGPEPALPVLEMVADAHAPAAEALAAAGGFGRWSGDWRDVVNDPEIDVVDITTPNDVHAEIALAALAAGKHVYCEKPLAMDAAEARRMTEAAEAAGVVTLVGFNFMKNPAQAAARDLIRRGAIGEVIQFRGSFDQDFMLDPEVPFSWRMERAKAGSGALGDMASHTISLSQMLVGDIASVCGMTGIYIHERKIAAGGSGHGARAGADAPMRTVENDDSVLFLVRYAGGAIGCIESSRLGSGRKLGPQYEIHGTKGALWFNQERMNELELYRHDDPAAERGYKTIFIGPEHEGYAPFFPIPGIGLGYNDQKILEARELIEAVATGRPASPDFRFGYTINRVVDAVLLSVAEQRWVRIDEIA